MNVKRDKVSINFSSPEQLSTPHAPPSPEPPDDQAGSIKITAFKCENCNRKLKSKSGYTNHNKSCLKRKAEETNEHLGKTWIGENQEDVRTIGNVANVNIAIAKPEFTWNGYGKEKIEKDINEIYEKIVFWRRNLFLLPTGKNGTRFIEETTRLFNEFLHDSPQKTVAMKAVMIMPSLLLQKPSRRSKARDHDIALGRRMDLWREGKFLELFEEAESIQGCLRSMPRAKTISEISKLFVLNMQKGNVNAAKNGILPLDNKTLSDLRMKHPDAKPADPEMLFQDVPVITHPIRFELIDEEMVKIAALRTKGGAGPSGMDGEGWCRILTSRSFGSSSTDLRKCFAEVIKKMCREDIEDTEAFLACRLIPLDKMPGLRPIGIGEILRRIAGKVVTTAMKTEVTRSVGSLQTCAGQDGGIEATIHAMREIFEEESTEAVLMVDASNAFNSVNRETFLHNVAIICPELATFVRNCYRNNIRLFVVGGGEISSKEGTTQGDPVAMIIYAIAIIPLILMLVDLSDNASEIPVKSAGYADDIAAGGKITKLKNWWLKMCEIGPKFGYFPESSKSWLIVKDTAVTIAAEVFGDTKINITSEGRRFLGGMLGSERFKELYVKQKVNEFNDLLISLSEIALHQPQAAYTAFMFGVKNKITFSMRTIQGISEHLKKLDETINNTFIPAITGGITCSEIERSLLAMPPKLGGLGIPIFSQITDTEFKNSQEVTESLKNDIKNQVKEWNDNEEVVRKKKQGIKNRKRSKNSCQLDQIRAEMSEVQRRLNDLAREKHASLWLCTIPIKDEGYHLTKQQFWDLIHIRYGWQLSRTPINCACGSKFDLDHALTCKKGGFISLRHNHLRNVTAKLLGEVCKDITVEPLLTKITGEDLAKTAITGNEARLDISARGFWEAHQKAFFDIRVFNPMAKRYATQKLRKSFEINEQEKKRGYNDRILQVENGTFTPLVFAATGGLGRECERFYDRLSGMICEKRKESYNKTVTWVRRKISFSLINSISICVRGSRTPYDSYNKLGLSLQEDVASSEKRSS